MKKKLILAVVLVLLAVGGVSFAVEELFGKKSSDAGQGATETTAVRSMDGGTTESRSVTEEPPVSRTMPDGTVTEEQPTKAPATEQPGVTDTEAKASSGEGAVTPDSVPAYSGKPYCELDGNVPRFTTEEKKSLQSFETYSRMDRQGRCGKAFANLSAELMPEEERGQIGHIRPSGWHTVKYNDLIDGNYLYNRCHLIAYSLAGENDNELNLITGTRYLNIEGMLPFEERTLGYIRRTKNHVLYRVTPVYAGDDLVASGVEMEAWSVEDEGRGLCFHVYCYNVQPGIIIDYATGESRRAEEGEAEGRPKVDTETGTEAGTESKSESKPEVKPEPVTTEATGDGREEARTYILNTNTKKIHLPSCDSVNDMKEKNKQQVTDTLEQLEKKGYKPCKRCLD